MKGRYLVGLFILFLSAAITLFYLSLHHKALSDQNEAQVSSLLRQLKLLNASADREILQIKIRNQTSFDQLTALRLEHNNRLTQLESGLHGVFSEQETQKLLAQYRVLNSRSESIISQFKSSIAYTENSYNYSFHLAREILQELTAKGYHDAQLMARQLQVDVLRHYTKQQSITAQGLGQRIGLIRALFPESDIELGERLAVLQRHLEIVFEGQSSINAALDNLFALGREQILDSAHSMYLERASTSRQLELIYLVAAIVSTVLLILLLGFAIYRYIRLVSETESLSFAISESEASLERSNLELKKEAEQRKEAEQELKNAAIMYENCPLGVVICDAEQRVVTVNPAYERLTGTFRNAIIGQRPAILKDTVLPLDILRSIRLAMAGSGKWQGEIPVVSASGDIIPAEASIIATVQQSQLSRYIIMLSDISERKKSEDIIYRQANFDSLTLLPNRNLFHDRVTHTLADSRRNGKRFALLFIDIDNFKRINDTLGHTIGDELLKQVASRLTGSVREMDTLSRFGGDEFVLVIEDIADAVQIEPLLTKLTRCISEPITIDQHPALHVSGSIGVSVYPEDGNDLSTLIRCADMAMYKAKEQGKNTYCFYQEKMNADAHEYMNLETRLRSAMDNNELFLMYQPIYNLKSYTPDAIEALIRWRGSDGNLIPPDKFIPVAEESKMIIEIGEWVLRHACQQLVGWRETLASDIGISVNISVVQFRHPGFGDMLRRVLEQTGIDPRALILEITENLFLDDTDNRIYRLMMEIREMGVRISLDDFGTGYASLSYLKRFPVDIIKIDRSFISDLTQQQNDGSLVKAIITMADSLDMVVVAEGVETLDQLDWLAAAGCDKVQGFYCSRPVLEGHVMDLLQSSQCSAHH